MFSLDGKTVAIVGGGSGIGKAIAETVAGRGASVVISSRNAVKLETAAQTIPRFDVIALDMTDRVAIDAWASNLPDIDHLSSAHRAPLTGRSQRWRKARFGPCSTPSSSALT